MNTFMKICCKSVFPKKFLFVYLLTKMCVISRNFAPCIWRISTYFNQSYDGNYFEILRSNKFSWNKMKTSPMNAERSLHKHHACRLPMRHARYAFVVMPINPGKFGKQCNTVPKRVIQYWNCLHGLLEKIFNVQKKTSW